MLSIAVKYRAHIKGKSLSMKEKWKLVADELMLHNSFQNGVRLNSGTLMKKYDRLKTDFTDSHFSNKEGVNLSSLTNKYNDSVFLLIYEHSTLNSDINKIPRAITPLPPTKTTSTTIICSPSTTDSISSRQFIPITLPTTTIPPSTASLRVNVLSSDSNEQSNERKRIVSKKRSRFQYEDNLHCLLLGNMIYLVNLTSHVLNNTKLTNLNKKFDKLDEGIKDLNKSMKELIEIMKNK